MKRIEFVITEDEDGGFVGECQAVGAITQGETIYEVLDNLGDAYRVSVAEERAEDIRSGKVIPITAEEVMKCLGAKGEPSQFERDIAEDMNIPEYAEARRKMQAQMEIIERVLCEITCETEDDGRFIASLDIIGGCLAYGATEHEARRRCGVLALHTLAERLKHNEVGE